jgi:hypothetical protein
MIEMLIVGFVMFGLVVGIGMMVDCFCIQGNNIEEVIEPYGSMEGR